MTSHPPHPVRNYMILADGENLVFGFQTMLEKFRPRKDVVHIKDEFVWSPALPGQHLYYLIRANYYTSVVGNDETLAELERQIADIRYGSSQICPRIFKKAKQSHKSRLVDISICIDALRHSNHGDVEAIMLLSGDGDYLPLIKEVMRNGTQVWLGAFSNGLNPRLKSAVDRFLDLDPYFLEPTPALPPPDA